MFLKEGRKNSIDLLISKIETSSTFLEANGSNHSIT